MQRQVNTQAGMVPSLRQIYRARKRLLGDVDGVIGESFSRVGPYLEETAWKNPGSHFSMETATNGQFLRMFLALDQCVKVRGHLAGVSSSFGTLALRC